MFYRALARRLGATFLAGAFTIGDGVPYRRCLEAGAAPLVTSEGGEVLVAAPRGAAVARLIAVADRLAQPLAVTTPTALRQALFARYEAAIAEDASETLGRLRPEWSCRPGPLAIDLVLAGSMFALVVLLARLPTMAGFLLLLLIQGLMLTLLTFRLTAAGIGAAEILRPTEPEKRPALLTDEELPTYTILIALYREAPVVPRLLGALRRLDYPVLCSNLTQKR